LPTMLKATTPGVLALLSVGTTFVMPPTAPVFGPTNVHCAAFLLCPVTYTNQPSRA